MKHLDIAAQRSARIERQRQIIESFIARGVDRAHTRGKLRAAHRFGERLGGAEQGAAATDQSITLRDPFTNAGRMSPREDIERPGRRIGNLPLR